MKNPQTFNRYSYALNSPYKFTDPLGLSARCGPGCVTESEYDGTQGKIDEGKEKEQKVEIGRASDLSQKDFNRGLTRYIFERASQGYADDSGGMTTSTFNYSRPVENSSEATVESLLPNPPDKLVGPWVLPKDVVDDLVAGNIPIQGDGDCAKLPQILLDGQMGITKEWAAGQNVTDFVNGPPRGTVIATMENGKYPGAGTGNHVAIFLNLVISGDTVTGMRVVNQYKGLKQPKVSTIPLPQNTTLPKVPSAAAIVDMRTYYVVYRRVKN
jgi:hypothetical protein